MHNDAVFECAGIVICTEEQRAFASAMISDGAPWDKRQDGGLALLSSNFNAWNRPAFTACLLFDLGSTWLTLPSLVHPTFLHLALCCLE